MKKNITINLFGSLFSIDEDAYELLKKYEDSLHAYFSKQEGGEEIADDIERRIAELFAELKAQGTEAISIEHVQDIIKRIGAPEQMDTENAEEEQPSQQATGKTEPKKKFFRDPNDQMLGGVMSGFAHYFGGDVLLWRLLVIILCFTTTGFVLLAYIALWIIIPLARTPEDFLRMNGQKVNLGTLAKTIVNNNSAMGSNSVSRTGFDRLLEVCTTIVKILLYVIGAVLFLCFGGCLIATIVVALVALIAILYGGTTFTNFYGSESETIAFLPTSSPLYFWMLILACFICSIIPMYCIVHHILRNRKKVNPMSLLQRCTWMVVWIISIGAIIAFGTMLFRNIVTADDNLWKSNHPEFARKKDSPNNAAWEKCYQAFLEFRGKDAPIWVCKDETDQYSYDECFSNLTPGVYRFSARAMSDTRGCYFCVDIDGNKKGTEISYGTPEKLDSLSKSLSTDSTATSDINKKTTMFTAIIECLPECSVDSIILTQPTTLKCCIVTSDILHYKTFKGSYIVHAPNFKIEKLDDASPKKHDKHKSSRHTGSRQKSQQATL